MTCSERGALTRGCQLVTKLEKRCVGDVHQIVDPVYEATKQFLQVLFPSIRSGITKMSISENPEAQVEMLDVAAETTAFWMKDNAALLVDGRPGLETEYEHGRHGRTRHARTGAGKDRRDHVPVKHRPRLLSDNGSAYLSHKLAAFLEQYQLAHTRGKPYHLMTQGKIERYHRSLKNIICLENHYFPGQLEHAIGAFVEHYNQRRYHEALDNLTPADVYFGRAKTIVSQRHGVKQRTLQQRRATYLMARSTA
jgi:hypothetical protein